FSLLFIVLLPLAITCKELGEEKKQPGQRFGKEWLKGPDEELLERNIYFVRHYKDTISEQLFDKYNVDPREVAKLVVVKYAKDMAKVFEQKNYEDFVWEFDRDITTPLAEKLKIKNENGAVQNLWIKKLSKNDNAYCNSQSFFTDPIKKIEIRAYRVFDPSVREDGPTRYVFTYRIDFVHTLEPIEVKEGEEPKSRSNAITVYIGTDFVKEPNILITRIIDHCPIPELKSEDDYEQ
ncbi:hypothetical protein, partial [Leptospira idonii]|uniref:hypothetical protein n=1 Tax=Leptospira idonii TaxID=1193500 RepID=UPI0014384CCB